MFMTEPGDIDKLVAQMYLALYPTACTKTMSSQCDETRLSQP